MAEKYIMLECNRLRANLNYKNIDESEDIFKNRWVNNVNSYGIVVNPEARSSTEWRASYQTESKDN